MSLLFISFFSQFHSQDAFKSVLIASPCSFSPSLYLYYLSLLACVRFPRVSISIISREIIAFKSVLIASPYSLSRVSTGNLELISWCMLSY